jgi:antirestriction protein
MAKTIDNSDDVIDFRDVTDRFEELRDAEERTEEEQAEFDNLQALLNETRGNGGDHQWEGDWYPGSMIRDSYFKDYAMELAEDIGAIDANASWPNSCIDWEQAARELRMDYSSVEFDGVDYWYR